MTSAASAPRSSSRAAATAQALTELLAPVAAAAGYDLEDVEVVPAGRRSVVRVTVDRDGGLDLDAVAEMSREFDAALDASADVDRLLASPFTLEVSSPGVDRPLTEPRHWRRAVGRLVEVALGDGDSIRGRVLAADDASVTFGTDAGERALGHDALGPGRVQVEFNGPDGTGTGGAR